MPAVLAAILPLLGSAVSSGMGLIGSVASSVTGAIAKLAGGIIGSVISGVVRVIAAIPSLIFGVVRGLVGAVGSIIGAVGNAAGSILKAGSTIGGVFLGAIAAAATGLKAVTSAAMEFAKNARTFSAQTGIGVGQSGSILNNLSALGIGNDAAGAAFGNQNPGVFGMKAGVFGLPSYTDPEFVARFAARYQQLNSQGMIGNIMARAMSRTLGVDNPEFLRAATYSPANIQRNQAYSQNINARLGLDPREIARLSEEIPLGLARLTSGLTAISQKVVSIALPYLESGVARAADFIAANADKIGGWIETAVTWIFETGPQLLATGFQMLTGAAQWGVDGIIGIAEWVGANLPGILSNAVQWVADGLSSFSNWVGVAGPKIVQGVAKFLGNVGLKFSGFLGGIADFIEQLDQSDAFEYVIKEIARSLDNGVLIFKGFAGVIGATFATIQNLILKSPIAEAFRQMGFTNIFGVDLMAQPLSTRDAYQTAYDAIPTTDFLGAAENFFNSNTMSDAVKDLRQAAKDQQDFFNGLSQGVTNYGGKFVNSLAGGSGDLANWLAPPGQENKGMQLGSWVAGLAGNIENFTKERIKPTVDNLANMASGATGPASKESRDSDFQKQFLANQREQIKLLQKGNETGATLPQQVARLMGFALYAQAEAEGRAILGQ
jgi:hypothetical protein